MKKTELWPDDKASDIKCHDTVSSLKTVFSDVLLPCVVFIVRKT